MQNGTGECPYFRLQWLRLRKEDPRLWQGLGLFTACGLGAKVVGLGVTLNPTSVTPVPRVVIDHTSAVHSRRVTTVRPEAVRDLEPSQILAEAVATGIKFPFPCGGRKLLFQLCRAALHEAALALRESGIRHGRPVPWFSASYVPTTNSPDV